MTWFIVIFKTSTRIRHYLQDYCVPFHNAILLYTQYIRSGIFSVIYTYIFFFFVCTSSPRWQHSIYLYSYMFSCNIPRYIFTLNLGFMSNDNARSFCCLKVYNKHSLHFIIQYNTFTRTSHVTLKYFTCWPLSKLWRKLDSIYTYNILY